ncbi:VCBS domain-containing protein [Pseudovibrio sp. Tun.PSC04-5.I4]|uniref:beta strand repeat-containing protein n=1 Tax=Pseudovibrio sp. Tun.PSC04-5.I4 TaxID=1798213 RepID=UPI00088C85CB|nr:VCBS domain-containing protein [Pseudovibrio sp. Tun.PSC04-5.I4]SDR49208.1 VCBS repeat-containing protein [Pseudovibrio sp. Tun.PSC04-5.I4]
MPNSTPISSPVLVNTDENGVTSIRVIFQDSDLSDIHSLTLNTDEMTGSGIVVSDDTFHYDPGTAFDYLAAGETATDTFSYTVTDAAGESSTSTVTITITGHNDGPVAAALASETDENTSITIPPDVTDPDNNDTHSFTVDTSGTVGSVTVNADGTFSYDPNGKFEHLGAGETATDTFTYTVTDAVGESSTETVTVTINGIDSNTSPDTFPYEFTTDEDTKIVFRTIFHDPDVGDTHTYSLNTDGLEGTLTETGDGVFEYDPGTDFDYLAVGETGTTTFTYTVTDSFGASDTDTITITVTGRNDRPVASAMNVSTSESSPLVITPDFTDPDASDTHTFTVDTSSTTGTVTLNDDGTFTYNPNGKFNDLDQGEAATDSFTYTVTDSAGESSTETVTVTIQGESEVKVHPGKLVASDGAKEDYFGSNAQVNDHGVVVVGSQGDDDKGSKSGSVYVYTPDGDGYVETKLMASDGAANDGFGIKTVLNNSGVIAVSASIDGDKGPNSGSIYVYTPTEGGSYSEVKLTASDGVARDVLGYNGLSINADGVIVATAYGTTSDRIYIFTPDGSGGYTETKLVALGDDGFGHNVTINDAGVVFADSPGKLARVFTPDGEGGYTEMQLTAPDSNASFGISGAVEGDGTIVVGANSALYIYEPDGSGNYAVSKLITERAFGGDQLAINESGVIVAGGEGYSVGSSSSRGIVGVYVPDGSGSYTQIFLTAYDGATSDHFGNSVSINEAGVIAVGAYFDDDKGNNSGSAYIFVPNDDGNYVGADGTVYEPTGTPVINSYSEHHEADGDGTAFKLVASDGAKEDYFGSNAQVNDHGVVVVGSQGDDDKGSKSGSVYVYTPDGDGYVETKLMASDGAANDGFGIKTVLNNSGVIAVSASIDGDKGPNSGSIYVYTPTEGGSYSEVKLTASDGVARDVLGYNGLSINADGVIVATAYGTTSDRIYIFTPDGSGGYTETKLVALGDDGFGHNVTINDAGVVFADSPGKLARVFTPDGEGGYTEMQLTAPDSNASFGISGAVEGDGTIVVGANSALYIYEPDGSGNYAVSKLITERAFGGDQLAINESGVIVAGGEGYSVGSSSSRGIVGVYVPDGSGSYTQIFLTAYDGATSDHFGNSVSINEAGVIAVGAYFDDDKGNNSGSAYIFVPNDDGNYVGADGTVYEPTGTPVIETFETPSLEIIGSDAAETLLAGDGADVIYGNGGADRIIGGAGDDQLSGGDGNDTFVFAAGDIGHDVISGFTAGEGSADVIEIETAVFADFAALIAAAEDSGANTVITFNDATSITLQGVKSADLHQDDFLFV